MKAKELREKSVEDLAELEKSLVRDAFQARFKNFTSRLDDTSSLKKARRDVARVKTLLTERANIGEATASHAEAPKAVAKAAKPAAAPKTKAVATTAKTAKTAKTKGAKASEASK